MTDAPVNIHIGIRKGGSTFLQERVFSRHPDAAYLGLPYSDPVMETLMQDLTRQDSLAFDFGRASDMAKEALGALESDAGKKPTISDEFLTQGMMTADRALIAERVKRVFGAARILFVIRNQIDFVQSDYFNSYRMWVHGPKTLKKKIVPFEEFLEYSWKNYRNSPLAYLDYDAIVGCYLKIFGPEQVLVLPFEELSLDTTSAVRRICAFFELDEDAGAALAKAPRSNPQVTAVRARYQALRTRLLPNLRISKFVPKPVLGAFHGILDRGSSARLDWPEGWKERLSGHYADSNRKLAARLDIDLGGLGYPV